MICPHCKKEIDDGVIARHLASKGGSKYSSSLTPEQRSKRAKKAIASRWKNHKRKTKTLLLPEQKVL